MLKAEFGGTTPRFAGVVNDICPRNDAAVEPPKKEPF
jgi:hypothetical protein